MIRSSALEANLATYQVDVTIDDKYRVIQDALSKYYGIQEGVLTFLTELSHPHKNWGFIVKEARGYALNYFHLLAEHEAGPAAADRLVQVFIDAVGQAREETTQADAADNLLLFIQKILRDAGNEIDRFLPVVDEAFRRIWTLDDTDFFRFVKSHYQIRKLAALLLKRYRELDSAPPDDGLIETNRLLYRYLRQTYRYFLSEDDPQPWFQSEVEETDLEDRLGALFAEISHERLEGLMADLAVLDPDTAGDLTEADRLEQLLDFPGFGQIAEIYRDLPRQLFDLGRTKERGNRWKVIFLFHIMNLRGLSEAHEDALREINRTLSWLIAHEKHLNVERLIRKTFSILKARTSEFPSTALSCVFNMGKGVYKTDDSELVNFFIDSVIDLGFQSPMIGGVGNDWQIRVNPAHILNIRIWMSLIELNPRWSTRLLSTLIIHLTLEGVFIKDTDLFPRDITRFLNSHIEPVYNLAKQLTKLFPVYFNEIGAEGTLRDISTRIDELCHRKDPLIHFLRKQTHVESSNRIVGFMEATIRFWLTRDKTHVAPFVPPSIEETIVERGRFIDGVHRVVTALSGRGMDLPAGLLSLSDARLEKMVSEIAAEDDAVDSIDAERVTLAAALYRQLHQKYTLVLFESEAELDRYFSKLKSDAFPDPDKLKKAIAEPDLKSRMFAFLDYLEELKRLIVSPTTFEIREDIYKKRHFTVDIPSMYGSYHETKFDALGLTFRIESLLNAQFDDLIENIDLGLVTKSTFFQIYDKLILFAKALRVEGISSMELDSQIDLLIHSLEARGFTFTQYLDIFKGFARTVRNIINDHFNNIHEENLTRVLAQVPLSAIHDRFKTADVIEAEAENEEAARHAITEIFFREKISTSLGLQQLDRFLSQILNTLFHQSQKLRSDHLRLLLNYDPKRAMMSIFNPRSDAIGIIYLGNKGFNLVKLRNFGLPVPPGFIITTEVFRCRSIIEVYPPAQENFRDQVREHVSSLEEISGKSFGDNQQPLLLSVRSGSSISQPGMMDTFLDVGINEEIAAGMAESTGNAWFAWDCYRRFIQCYGMGHGLSRDEFDAIIKTFKELWDIPLKKGFPGEMMRSVALAYKRMVEEDAGIEIPEEPYEQLLSTIQLVLHSWDTPKARTYRKIMGISDDWGTAVTVQAMVFGNRSESSGTGVFFTHNPRWPGDDSIRLWGDFTVENQGEDVVSGLVNTMPISISQQNIEMRDTDTTLETHFPEIYSTLKTWAEELIYKKRWSPQEIEFTFESAFAGDLYLLQTRDMAIRERKKVMTFDPEEMKDAQVLGHGIGVSGGAMSGRVVFSLDEIDHWREEEPTTPLIVLRADTVPDDIREIHSADGILTARGGLTSHAAVVAHRLGKTCVVGCGSLVCREREKTGTFEGHTVTAGDFISIDGQEGSVYLGRMAMQEN